MNCSDYNNKAECDPQVHSRASVPISDLKQILSLPEHGPLLCFSSCSRLLRPWPPSRLWAALAPLCISCTPLLSPPTNLFQPSSTTFLSPCQYFHPWGFILLLFLYISTILYLYIPSVNTPSLGKAPSLKKKTFIFSSF